VQQENGGNNHHPQARNHQKIFILESSGDAKEWKKEKIELTTSSGTRILVSLAHSMSKVEKISVIINDDIVDASPPTENSIEMEVLPDSVSLTTRRDLRIKAKNIEIEADDKVHLKSGSTMTINGSLIKIN
jgi:hypothetical protein